MGATWPETAPQKFHVDWSWVLVLPQAFLVFLGGTTEENVDFPLNVSPVGAMVPNRLDFTCISK